MIPALVLTAGLASRLRPLSLVRAKAALPIAGEPLIRRIIRSLQGAGICDLVLNLHHRPETLTRELGDGDDLGVRIRYSWEVPLLGSAGGPRRAMPLLGSPTFLIVNGDTLADVDLQALIADHRRSGALVTMAVVPNIEPDKYGGVLVDASGAITGFVRRGSAEPSYHFTFAQVVEAAAFERVSDSAPSESVGALYPALMAERPGSVRAHVCAAEYADIGTPEDYLRTALLLARRDGRSPHGSNVTIAPSARIEESVLWDGVTVEPGALLRGCVVTDGVRVPSGTSWTGRTLRRAGGELADDEAVIGDIAVAGL